MELLLYKALLHQLPLGLSASTHAIRVQYDLSQVLVCLIYPKRSLPQAETVTASVTTQPTCTTGATITASASGEHRVININ
jgi:hypothetical protein